MPTLRIPFTLLSFLLFTIISFGQNLVPNNSFEDNTTLPCGFISSSAVLDLAATGWIYASGGTSDIHSTEVLSSCWNCASSATGPGIEAPRTGEEMAGFYNKIPGRIDGYREYIQIKLDKPTVVGETYCVEMYVSLADASAYASNNIGLLLSTEQIVSGSFGAIARPPHVNESDVVTTKSGWHQVTGTIVADSAYEWVTIGNFYSYAATDDTFLSSTGSNWAYYFFDDVFVILAPEDTTLVSTKDTAVCPGDTISLTPIINDVKDYGGYTWNTGEQDTVLYIDAPGKYWVDYFQCDLKRSDTFYVESSGPKVFLGNDTVLCAKTNLLLTANGDIETYLWNTGDTTFSIIATSTGWYSVLVTDSNACINWDSIYVEVTPLFDGTVNDDIAICFGDSVQLNAGGGASYLWNSESSLSALGINNPFAKPNTTTTYVVKIEDPGNCNDDFDTTTVIVNPVPISTLIDRYTLYLGESIQFSASGGTSYSWTPTNGLSCTDCPDPFFGPDSTTWYFVLITDDNGCQIVDSILIEVLDNSFVGIPNAFTPNNDGVNDFFVPIPRGVAELDYFRIYNRWGQMLFEGQNWEEGWSGADQDIGVYVYTIRYKLSSESEFRVESGSVNLIR